MTETPLETALRLRRAGRLTEAAVIYADMLKHDPRNFDALHGLGILRFQGGQLTEAERLIGEAIAMRPGSPEALYNRACLHARMNRPEEALKGFEAAIAARPDYVEAWVHRAAVLLMLQRYDDAIGAGNRALALRPGQAQARDIVTRARAARPSLAQWERDVAAHNVPAALDMALRVLHAIDERFGRLDGVDPGEFSGGNEQESARRFAVRFAAAFERLLNEPGLVLPAYDCERLLVHHRWIDLMFSLANIVPRLPPDLPRRLLLQSLNAQDTMDFDAVWREDLEAAAPAFLHYLSTRYVFEPRAFALRERLLEWLPDKLSEVTLSPLTLSRMADAYMHCSYAATPRKHAIKAALMQQWRRACLQAGCLETPSGRGVSGGPPTAIVVAENLVAGHSVYRTHSRAIAALKERFHVVGVVFPDPKGTEIEALFHECLPLAGGDIFAVAANLSAQIRVKNASLLFYVGVGMVPPFVALASLRLAPVQCVSFGHTATTMSPALDYFVLPADFVGSADVFSEKVVALPKEAMPFAMRPTIAPLKPASDGTVRVAVPASTMKLNPMLFDAIADIAKQARTPCEIHFFPLGASGLAYAALADAVRARIPNATVFPEMSHEAYVEHLNRCDLFLSPFPYGNMNSIVDAFRLGLPGVCLDGAEAHAHADGAFFARIGLPPELTAQTVAQYVAQAVKLIDAPAWRMHCRDIVAHADLASTFCAGDAKLFADAMAALIGKV